MKLRLKVMPAVLGTLVLALPSGLVHAAEDHTRPVLQDAADYTPQVVSTTAIPRPRVDAITSSSTTTYAGGHFNKIATDGGASYDRSNLVAFSTSTGSIRESFRPTFDKPIRAVEGAADGGVYVGGDFTTVNGVTRRGLVKLTADGAVDTSFKPPFSSGLVYDIELVDGHLIVAGNAGGKLMSLKPVTGASDGMINNSITGQVCVVTDGKQYCSWGKTTVYDFAVAGSRLVAVGNFTTVDGKARSRFFMLNLNSTGSTLDPWYYDGFAKRCATEHPRRIANLQGIDFNPAGTAFSVAATGQIPESSSDIWYKRLGNNNKPNTTVCDAIGRFNVSDATKPAWINYTGGDSMWTVADTGAAVYVQGHFRYVDNPDGYASKPIGDKTSLAPAAQRKGIAAINPSTGMALPWDPVMLTPKGGKALEATSAGLWVGSDSKRFGAETHYGIAFAPR